MSFLTRTTPRMASRLTFAPRAAFSTSFVNRKTPVETVKDAAKVIDRAVSDKIVGGIEVGEQATQKVKEVSGMSAGEAKGKANELAGEAKGKANELSGQAKGKANELAGEAKGKKEEVKRKI